MDYTKETQSTCHNLTTKADDLNIDHSEQPIPQTQDIDVNRMPEKFYKNAYTTPSGQNIIKHGYRAYRIYPSQQDLTMFCLSLFQFEAAFPLRFFTVSAPHQKDEKDTQATQQKDIWLQTQFLSLSHTVQMDRQKQLHLENRVHKFFTEFLIPKLMIFKEEKMSWDYMVTESYTDQKVIEQFQNTIIKQANEKFKIFAKGS